MIDLITSSQFPQYPNLLDSMHRDRKRVFVDLFGWQLDHENGREADAFDDEHAEYLVLPDRSTGLHRASIRLLRTDRPHLMTEIFSELCDVRLPRGPHVREITRFCIAPDGSTSARRTARNMLAHALIEYGLIAGVTTYTAVCQIGLLQQILAAGWRCRPLGMPRTFAGETVGAFAIEIAPETFSLMSNGWRWREPALRLADNQNLLAA